jgi:hypothetical protein
MTKNELAQHAIALQQRIDNLEANKYVHINEIESLHIRPGELWIGHYDDAFLVIDVKTLFSWIPNIAAMVIDENKKETKATIQEAIDNLNERAE